MRAYEGIFFRFAISIGVISILVTTYFLGYFGNNFQRVRFVNEPTTKNGSTLVLNEYRRIEFGPRTDSPTAESLNLDEPTCQPQNNIVFIKTAKTGGSTMASIIYRYALRHDLIAAVDPDHNALIQEDESAEHYVIETYNCSDFPGYNIIASHIYYNRPAMEEIVSDAKYITIIRFPQSQIKSAFYFMKKDELFPNAPNPFGEYVKLKYEKYIESGSRPERGIHNDFKRFNLSTDESTLASEIQRLDNELDLVMLTEYYDESLILLGKLLCWDFEDLVYHKMKEHKTEHPPVTPQMEHMITELTSLDIKFYNYFNDTLWEKIRRYEGNFTADLQKFRAIQNEVDTTCRFGNESHFCRLLHNDCHFLSVKLSTRNEEWIC